jgi:hypothetical protein
VFLAFDLHSLAHRTALIGVGESFVTARNAGLVSSVGELALVRVGTSSKVVGSPLSRQVLDGENEINTMMASSEVGCKCALRSRDP